MFLQHNFQVSLGQRPAITTYPQIFYPRHVAGEAATIQSSAKSIVLTGRSSRSLGASTDPSLPAFADHLLAEAQTAAVPGSHSPVAEVMEAAVTLMGSTQAQLEDMTSKYGSKLVQISRQALLHKLVREVGAMDIPTPPADLSLATPLPEGVASVAAMIVERQMVTYMQVWTVSE